MDHPQDFVKLTFKDRLYIWWLKFAAWTPPIKKLFLDIPKSERSEKDVRLTRRDENKLFIKIIKPGIEALSPEKVYDELNRPLGEPNPMRLEPSNVTINIGLWAGDPYVRRFKIHGQSLLSNKNFDIEVRWWAERWILKQLKKKEKGVESTKHMSTRIDDIIIDTHTKNI